MSCGECHARHLLALAEAFVIARPLSHVTPLGRGLINDTYRLEAADCSYVLQRINGQVFPAPEQIMANLHRLAQHPHSPATYDLCVPRLIPTYDGASFVRDAAGAIWRLLEFIPETRTLTRLDTPEQAREVGRVLGRFHRWTAHLPNTDFAITLPGYHDTARYFKRLAEMLIDAPPELTELRAFILDRQALAKILEQALTAGQIALYLTHGDPKLDNILFDQHGRQARALIDLDTVQPGLIQHDLGDCLRSCCNALGEGETDPTRVSFDLQLAAAILGGYAEVTRAWLNAAEIDRLFDGIRVMPFELGMRFLIDHLNGDRYFKVDRPGRNLIKAQIQFALVADIERQEQAIRAVIDEVFRCKQITLASPAKR